MHSSTLKLVCLFFFIGVNTITYSQNKTFDYLNANLSTTDCNVFDPSANIDGVAHNSWAGGVIFNWTLG